jgi:hypothetical protein
MALLDDKREVLLLATLIADLIVLIGFGTTAVLAIRLLNAKVRAATVPEAPDPMRPLLYVAAVLFWPAALALGMARLGSEQRVRTARAMLLIALGHLTFAVLVAIAIVTAVALRPPRLLLDLLP